MTTVCFASLREKIKTFALFAPLRENNIAPRRQVRMMKNKKQTYTIVVNSYG
jgi:hypothetical protein